jgi:hypothetical protein
LGEVNVKKDTEKSTYTSWTQIWKQCLGIMMAIIVLFMSMIAGVMISSVLFHAVEL